MVEKIVGIRTNIKKILFLFFWQTRTIKKNIYDNRKTKLDKAPVERILWFGWLLFVAYMAYRSNTFDKGNFDARCVRRHLGKCNV